MEKGLHVSHTAGSVADTCLYIYLLYEGMQEIKRWLHQIKPDAYFHL